jgi:RNA polymerase sigma-70 factor (ECF subfamily)
MGHSRVFLQSDLTFLMRLSTVVHVELELEPCGGGGADDSAIQGYVQRAQSGDPEGHKQLFRLSVRRLHRLVYRLAGPGADVDDLVQAIFVEAFRALPGFRGEAAFFTWLSRIAVRTTLRQRRRAGPRTLPFDEGSEDLGASSPERLSDARRALARFDAILATLSEKRRVAFVLHVLEGHSLAEVAALLDASVAAVKVRIHDARIAIERQARCDPYLAHYLEWEKKP